MFRLFPLVQYASAQTAIIDWSQVRVAADGSTEFGPTVEVGESRLNASGMLGYFGNSDGYMDMAGRHGQRSFRFGRTTTGVSRHSKY